MIDMRFGAAANVCMLLCVVVSLSMGSAAAPALTGESDGWRWRAGFSDTVREKQTVTECLEYDNRTGTCTNESTQTVAGQHTYVFDWKNIKVSETANGNVHVSAVLKPNDITKIIQKEQRPALSEQEAIQELNKMYLWNGGEFDREAYRELVDTAKKPVVSVAGEASTMSGAAVQTEQRQSIMSSSGRTEFTIVVPGDGEGQVQVKIGQNSGILTLSTATDFRPPNPPNDDASTDGVTPDRLGQGSQSAAADLSSTIGIGYGSATYWGGICAGDVTLTICDQQPNIQYRFDNDAGFSTVLDLSGNSNDGTINGDPTEVAGVWDTHGFLFDDTDDYIDTDISLNLDSDFTVSGWFRTDVEDSNNDGIAQTTSSDADGLRVYINSFSPGQTGCVLRDSNGNIYQATNTGVAMATWTHISCVYDAGSETLDTYINGQNVASADTSGNAGFTASGDLEIGRTQGRSAFYDGEIDEVVVWDGYAASSTEIESKLWQYGGDFVTGGGAFASTWTSERLNDSSSEIKSWDNVDVQYYRGASTANVSMRFWTDSPTQGVFWTGQNTGANTASIDLSPLSTNESIRFDTKMKVGDNRFSPYVQSVSFDWTFAGQVADITLQEPADNAVFETPTDIQKTINYVFDVNKTTSNSTTVDLIRDGSVIQTSSQTSSFDTYNISEDLSTGTYSWSVNVTDDGDGDTASSPTRTFQIQNETVINVKPQTPKTGDQLTENDIVNVSTDIENFRPEQVTIEQYVTDSGGSVTNLSSDTVAADTNKTVWDTVQLSPGNYTATTEAYDPSGNFLGANSTGTFEVTDVPVELNPRSPVQGQTFVVAPGSDASVEFKFDVTSNVSGDAIYRDHTGLYNIIGSHSGNGSTITYSDTQQVPAGDYNWTAGFDDQGTSPPQYETSPIEFSVVEENAASIKFDDPQNNDTVQQGTVDISYTVDTDYDAEIELFLENVTGGFSIGEIANHSKTSTGSVQYTDSVQLDPATYDARVEVTSQQSGTTYTEQIRFNVAAQAQQRQGLLGQAVDYLIGVLASGLGVSQAAGATVFGFLIAMVMATLFSLPFLYFSVGMSATIWLAQFLAWTFIGVAAGWIPTFYLLIMIVVTGALLAKLTNDFIR